MGSGNVTVFGDVDFFGFYSETLSKEQSFQQPGITLVTHGILYWGRSYSRGYQFLVLQDMKNLVSHRLLVCNVLLGLSTRVLVCIKPNTNDWNLMKHLPDMVLNRGL